MSVNKNTTTHFLLLIMSVSILTPISLAKADTSVVINEIAWMGTETSPSDEWIELYNNSEKEIILDGWKLQAKDGTPDINLQGKIPAKGFFLLERTDDSTVSTIKADLIYKGALNNTGEHLKLADTQNNIIDQANFSDGWTFGDNGTKQTMERNKNTWPASNASAVAMAGWQTSANPDGTPKHTNSIINAPEVNRASSATPAKPDTKTDPDPKINTPLSLSGRSEAPSMAEYPENIFINEILPSPKGADAENEWIELYNSNNFEVELTNWQIQDTTGLTKIYTFPIGIKINPFDFIILKRTETKITLQNSGDGLQLLNPNQKIVYSVNYPKATQGQSYNRTDKIWEWSTVLTPKEQNIIPQPKKLSESRTLTVGKAEVAGNSTTANTLTANVKKAIPKTSSRILIFIFAVIIAMGSGVVVLLLKKQQNNH